MTKICIIPARGGSKRIPKKNSKLFLGKPIIAYSIEAAMKSQLFDVVMVSTDDEEIASIAIEYGAKIPFMRSAEASNDYATTFEVIKEVLEVYKEKYHRQFDTACCIYPTAPFVNAVDLKNSFKTLIAFNFDTVFPVMKFGFPVQRALKRNNDGKSFFKPSGNCMILLSVILSVPKRLVFTFIFSTYLSSI